MGAEDAAEFHPGSESAEIGDRADGGVGAGEKRECLFEADVLDFIQHGMPGRLAEAKVEESARTGESLGERHGRESVARLEAYHLDGFQDELLAPPRSARGAPSEG